MQILADISYSGGSSAGMTIRLKGGFGQEDTTLTQETPFRTGYGTYSSYPDTVVGGASIVVAHNYEQVASDITSQGGASTRRCNFYLSDIGVKWPRWVRMELINTDQSKAATITCRADL